jgi:hypothetical protein
MASPIDLPDADQGEPQGALEELHATKDTKDLGTAVAGWCRPWHAAQIECFYDMDTIENYWQRYGDRKGSER